MKRIAKYWANLQLWYRRCQTWLRWWHWVQGALLAVLCVVAATFVTRTYWQGGFPYTHDGENHLARFVATSVAVREQQWPPRYATTVLNGYGFPVLQYNYPLANLISVPFLWLGMHPFTVFALQVTFFVAVGTFSVWRVLRRWWGRRASMVGIVSFLMASPLAVALTYRGNIGEVAAYGLFFWILWIWTVWPSRRAVWWHTLQVGSIAAFLLSHNVLAVMLAPLLVIWSIVPTFSQKAWGRWLAVWGLSIGLVTWFWIPAVLELSLVVLRQDSLAQQATQHFLTWTQMWWEPLRFGFSWSGSVDSLSMSLGGSVLVWLGLGSVALWFLQGVRQRVMATALMLAAVAVFLTLPISGVFWDVLPVLPLFQFPWRFLWLVSLCVPVIAAGVSSVLPRPWWWVVLLLLAWQVQWVANVRPVDRFTKDAPFYRMFPGSTTTREENRPVTFEPYTLPSYQVSPQVATGSATVEAVPLWRGSKHVSMIRVQQDSVMTEPIIFFPGWITTVDGVKTEQVFLPETHGLVAYRLPARPERPYEVVTRFGERTRIRAVAEGVSVLALVALLSWIGWEEGKTWRARNQKQEQERA